MPTGVHASSPGVPPKSFIAWCRAVGREGCRRFRVYTEDGTAKTIAYKNATLAAKTIASLGTLAKCEAYTDKDELIRVWHFPEEKDAATEPEEEPGYTKLADDSPDEKLLKTFAHLLADAHRIANRQLVEVVGIQSKHFAEERKNLVGLRLMNEKLLAQLSKKSRIRVSTDDTEGDGGEEQEEQDTWLQEFLQPMIQRMVGKAGKHVADEVAGEEHVNGAAEKGDKS